MTRIFGHLKLFFEIFVLIFLLLFLETPKLLSLKKARLLID